MNVSPGSLFDSPALAPSIHISACVEPSAQLGAGVEIGPFCHVGPNVVLGDSVRLISHVSIAGFTHIGARTRVFPFASIGHEPQDLKYRGEPVRLTIGEDCLIREGVTMNPGTAGGGSHTRVGARCVFLANAHVAHDCSLGADIILSNNVMLGGHCQIGDFVIISGGAAAHQFVRIGAHAFIGGLAGVENDVIPYGIALGNRAALAGLNIVGLKRRGFSRESIHDLRRAYRALFAPEGTLKERVEDVAAEFAAHTEVQQILDFLREGGERAICMPRAGKEDSV
jgi:UDP-N-acetylglucosamine acyltransferase